MSRIAKPVIASLIGHLVFRGSFPNGIIEGRRESQLRDWAAEAAPGTETTVLRTLGQRFGMSALPPKADMCGATRDVGFVPKADIASFNHRVGSLQQRRWDRDSERLRGPVVDD